LSIPISEIFVAEYLSRVFSSLFFPFLLKTEVKYSFRRVAASKSVATVFPAESNRGPILFELFLRFLVDE